MDIEEEFKKWSGGLYVNLGTSHMLWSRLE